MNKAPGSERPARHSAWRFARWLLVSASALILLCGMVCASAWWLINREVAPLTQQEIDHGYQRAVGWIRANEAAVMASDNLVLWWMIQTASQRQADTYLASLVERQKALRFGPGAVHNLTKRILEPKAEITEVWIPPDQHPSYQRFFFHALSCQPMSLPAGGDTSRFLHENACGPTLAHKLLGDPACATHQYMAFMFLRRTGCDPGQDFSPMESESLDDIEAQLRLDPVVKDAYLQRVLVLLWAGQEARVKPVWLRRVLATQQPDGGWAGHRHVPELPRALDPWRWREKLSPPAAGTHGSAGQDRSSFHASAQGLLIMALLRKPGAAVVPH